MLSRNLLIQRSKNVYLEVDNFYLEIENGLLQNCKFLNMLRVANSIFLDAQVYFENLNIYSQHFRPLNMLRVAIFLNAIYQKLLICFNSC